MEPTAYNVQCINGHVMEVIPGTKLEQKCQKRAEEGLLDALCLYSDECPLCIDAKRESARRSANMCSHGGCAFMPLDNEDDPCAKGCTFARDYHSVQDGLYSDQVRGLSVDA